MDESTESDEEPCLNCGGRGWKFVSARRGLLVSVPLTEAGSARVRSDCLGCSGTGLDQVA
jgi:hypothetical protein